MCTLFTWAIAVMYGHIFTSTTWYSATTKMCKCINILAWKWVLVRTVVTKTSCKGQLGKPIGFQRVLSGFSVRVVVLVAVIEVLVAVVKVRVAVVEVPVAVVEVPVAVIEVPVAVVEVPVAVVEVRVAVVEVRVAEVVVEVLVCEAAVVVNEPIMWFDSGFNEKFCCYSSPLK